MLSDRSVTPPNTGNAIRMYAGSGAMLYLAKPLGLNLDDKDPRYAGLDYHDLADMCIRDSIDQTLEILTNRGYCISAFTAHTDAWHMNIECTNTDVLFFGPEPTGLKQSVLDDPRVTQLIRTPMLLVHRNMNPSSAAATTAYEVWRQRDSMSGKWGQGESGYGAFLGIVRSCA